MIFVSRCCPGTLRCARPARLARLMSFLDPKQIIFVSIARLPVRFKIELPWDNVTEKMTRFVDSVCKGECDFLIQPPLWLIATLKWYIFWLLHLKDQILKFFSFLHSCCFSIALSIVLFRFDKGSARMNTISVYLWMSMGEGGENSSKKVGSLEKYIYTYTVSNSMYTHEG